MSAAKSSVFATPYRKHLSVWRRLMCKFSLCGGHVDHTKDSDGVWWVGLRCATCGNLLCPVKSRFQDTP
jgi:hypothetical protein